MTPLRVLLVQAGAAEPRPLPMVARDATRVSSTEAAWALLRDETPCDLVVVDGRAVGAVALCRELALRAPGTQLVLVGPAPEDATLPPTIARVSPGDLDAELRHRLARGVAPTGRAFGPTAADGTDDRAAEILDDLARWVPAFTYQIQMTGAGQQSSCVYASHHVRELHGLEPEDVLGGNVDRLIRQIHPEDLEGWLAGAFAAVAGRSSHEAVFRTVSARDGSVHWVKQSHHVREAGPDLLLNEGVVVSIDRTKQAELALAEAKALAERADRDRSELLARVSHEIRTPLTTLLGSAELLLQRRRSGTPWRFQLEAIGAAAGDLLAILDDVLAFVRLEHDRLTLRPEPFSPRQLVETVAARHRPTARRQGQRLRCHWQGDPATLSGDAVRIRQLLGNLIANALIHSGADGVEVEASLSVEGDELATFVVSVRDTGVGIAAADQARIFEPFGRVDPTRRGWGVGLWICRRIAARMGGALSCDSRPGAGTTFRFSLPLPIARGAPTALPAESRAPTPQTPDDPTVLLVEDHPVNRLILAALLEQLGLRVDVAGDGAQAVERVRAGSYDVVLMDCRMPVLDGFGATARIRALPGAAGAVPIVALTAHALDADRDRCLAAGMDAHLAKPVTLDALARTLAFWLGDLRQGVPARVVGCEPLASSPFDGLAPEARGRLLRLAAEDTRSRLAALRRAVEDGALATAAEEAHRIAGAQMLVAAAPTSTLCDRIEALAETGGVAALREAGRALLKQLRDR